MEEKKYLQIVAHYEACFQRHGDSHLGVDWASAQEAETRYRVMLELIRPPTQGDVSLLDFGCGTSHLLDFIRRENRGDIVYSGLDLSPKFIAFCRHKYPHIPYYCLDILEPDDNLPCFDYVMMNGVFTEKRSLSFEEMYEYFQTMVRKAFSFARLGLAFNAIAAHAFWVRANLFQLPLDPLAYFLTRDVCSNFVIRNDYGLPEYTVYLYRESAA